MKTKRFLIFFAFIIFIHFQIPGQNYPFLHDSSGLSGITISNGIEKPVTIRVIYDNYSGMDGMKPDWGYSIVIEGLEKAVLFDTGADPGIFASNFTTSGVDAKTIGWVVISHEHGDHTNGLSSFARLSNNIPVIIPHSFSATFKNQMENAGLHPELVDRPAKICAHLYTSGEFGGPVPEQALVLNTRKGLVVMTGCSHPGIVEMLEQIKSAFNKNIYMVFGGFHLLQKTDNEMNRIIERMKTLGVVKCGATHCTGDKQTKMIREAFGSGFFELGAGNIITLN